MRMEDTLFLFSEDVWHLHDKLVDFVHKILCTLFLWRLFFFMSNTYAVINPCLIWKTRVCTNTVCVRRYFKGCYLVTNMTKTMCFCVRGTSKEHPHVHISFHTTTTNKFHLKSPPRTLDPVSLCLCLSLSLSLSLPLSLSLSLPVSLSLSLSLLLLVL